MAKVKIRRYKKYNKLFIQTHILLKSLISLKTKTKQKQNKKKKKHYNILNRYFFERPCTLLTWK